MVGYWQYADRSVPFCTAHPWVRGHGPIATHLLENFPTRIDRLKAVIEAEKIVAEGPS